MKLAKELDSNAHPTVMSNYRRLYSPGGTVFLTIVTYQRQPIFAEPDNINRLRAALAKVKQEQPFTIDAAVVLPDHLHFLWTMPPDDANYSYRVSRMKVLFTWSLYGRGSSPKGDSASRQKHRESTVWHRRFWEHTIRDESDWQNHLNYIHLNPVKHGFVTCPHQWEFSSFHQWVKQGMYPANWACSCGTPP